MTGVQGTVETRLITGSSTANERQNYLWRAGKRRHGACEGVANASEIYIREAQKILAYAGLGRCSS
jgi:hypothetical protein